MIESKTTQQWRMFHFENPHVYERLVKLSRELRKRGQRYYSIAGLFEVLRFEHIFKTTGSEFKLANDFKPYYARLLMHKHKDLDGFFKLKVSVADEIDYPYEIKRGKI